MGAASVRKLRRGPLCPATGVGCMNAMPHDQEDAKMAEDCCPEGSSIGALRAAVVTEAETWIGTPFHHAARVKGAGVDCLMLLAEVYERAGITAGRINPPFYVPDWHL